MTDHENEALTIVLTTLNRRQLLADTLASISRQIQPDSSRVKLLIIDNGSTDDVVMMINKWIDTEAPHWLNTTLLTETRAGVCAARNLGLSVACSEWIMFFDSDDLMEPEHIKRVTQAIKSHQSEADIIYWDVIIEPEDGKYINRRAKVGNDIWLNVIMRGCLSTQRYCCRRDIMITAGGWDETLNGWNDWELSVRLVASGARLYAIPGETSVRIRAHSDSITGSNFTSGMGKWEKSIATVLEYTKRNRLEKAQRYTLMKMAVLAGNYAREGNATQAQHLMSQVMSYKDILPTRYSRLIFHWQRIAGKWSTLIALLSSI